METTTEKSEKIIVTRDSDSPLAWILLVIVILGLFGGCGRHWHHGRGIHRGPHHVVHHHGG